ncbi:hypothetical protein PVAP13_5KG366607 [Panicum virgatum]|uniref:Uncharacterized protein n=1 Tax=Panicum virgatum TaxID=38727 RepID=A0A8T0SJ07_PANVG|nr:hypothetical protein PVAP13_5KG366607 [Panicum virgatum]
MGPGSLPLQHRRRISCDPEPRVRAAASAPAARTAGAHLDSASRIATPHGSQPSAPHRLLVPLGSQPSAAVVCSSLQFKWIKKKQVTNQEP